MNTLYFLIKPIHHLTNSQRKKSDLKVEDAIKDWIIMVKQTINNSTKLPNHLLVFFDRTLVDVKAGDELTIHYNMDMENAVGKNYSKLYI